MKKIVAFVLVLALIWAVPGLRERIGTLMLPLLDRLGPVGETIANPVRSFRTKNEIAFYLRMLRDDHTEGRTLPTERTFQEWIDRRMPQETGIDPWGNAYWLRRSGRTYHVGSNGADGVRDTEDDVVQSTTI